MLRRPALIALAFAGLLAMADPAHAATLKLRILETTDVHMNLLDWDYYQDRATTDYGLARAATLIHEARAQSRNSLLFDNGDLLQGNPMGDWVARVKPLAQGQMHPAYKVLQALRYDAGNIGNHEFNYGLPFLRQAIASAAFPLVSANVMLPDGRTHAFTPYVILERAFHDDAGQAHRLKVGVIGFVPPQIMLWDKQHLEGKVVARDILQAARELVPRMREQGAQIVVAIAHSGFERGETVFFAENSVAPRAPTWWWPSRTPGWSSAPRCCWPRTPSPSSPRCPASTPSSSGTRTASSRGDSSRAIPRWIWHEARSTACPRSCPVAGAITWA